MSEPTVKPGVRRGKAAIPTPVTAIRDAPNLDGRPVIPDSRIEFRPRATDEIRTARTTGIENEALANVFVLEPNLEEAPLTPGTAYNTRMMAENEEGHCP